jgi:predicted DNA-binding antitoxin AbrB/MazE fold protein
MTAVQAIYDGQVFIPEKPCDIIRGSKVTLTIKTVNSIISEKQKKLAAFRKLTNEVNELNKTDPLPPEFDEIVSQRLQFRGIPVL